MSLTYYEENQLVNRLTIEQAIRQLSLREQLVVALKISGFTYFESALITGISMTRYGGVLKKARKTLKVLLWES